METKYWIVEEVTKGTRIRLKENLNNVPKVMHIHFNRHKLLGWYVYPLTSSLVYLGVEEKEFIDLQIKQYGRIHTLEEVDFTNHSVPYPLVGVMRVDFSKGIVIKFRWDNARTIFLKRLDKAVDELLTRK
ncbi:hypothetical protein COF68_05550 [Bacillus toyonensis]|uniref:hypothetical protein n=1 Tax=Bacillus toyonensis TaxID=155322 RepID=UPI000BFE4283|nr:hypothetical protein [Bacillus toyonensis]PHE64308.1 hypothetical protein COF68_05550 [Bacillus toyonensis]